MNTLGADHERAIDRLLDYFGADYFGDRRPVEPIDPCGERLLELLARRDR